MNQHPQLSRHMYQLEIGSLHGIRDVTPVLGGMQRIRLFGVTTMGKWQHADWEAKVFDGAARINERFGDVINPRVDARQFYLACAEKLLGILFGSTLIGP